MDMVRHLAQAQHLDSVLAGEDAIQCEIDQMVTIGVEQEAVIGASLVTVGQDIPDKLPTLHISQHIVCFANIGKIHRKSKMETVEWNRLINLML